MALYQYSGVNYQGVRVSGTVDARDDNDAALRVHELCQTILSLKRARFKKKTEAWDSVEEEEKKSLLDIQIGRPKLNYKVFSVMCNQFSITLQSGMPIAQAVHMVADTLTDKMLQRWLRKVLRDVESGVPLADSMAGRGGAFLPTTFVETIRAGEASGNLDISFANMSRHFEKQYKMKQQIRGAMAYPTLLLVVAIIVMTVIMVFVVPMFKQIFSSSGGEMPALTKAVMALSEGFKKYWWLFLVFAAGGFVLFKFLDSFPKMHLLFSRWLLRLPVAGNISLLSAAAQFTTTMSTLMGSGLTIVSATEITANVIGNAYVSRKTRDLIPKLEAGMSLGDAMRSQGVMPKMLIEMTAMGERSGELGETLRFIGEFYSGELDVATAGAVKKLGPAMLIAIGGVVLFIIAGVYAGMFGMYDSMGAAMGLGE